MANWSYKCYVDNKDGNLWSRWFNESTPHFRAAHEATFFMLEQMAHWQLPNFKPLRGRHGLGEVRFKGDNKQWRIFGFFESQKIFVVTGIGHHKGKIYVPKNIIDKSEARVIEIRKTPTKAMTCERPK